MRYSCAVALSKTSIRALLFFRRKAFPILGDQFHGRADKDHHKSRFFCDGPQIFVLESRMYQLKVALGAFRIAYPHIENRLNGFEALQGAILFPGRNRNAYK